MSKNKVIILGATSGIGKALTEKYIERGWIVGIAARRTNLLSEMAANCANVYFTTCDVQVPEKCVDSLEKLATNMGVKIDLFILCSGVGSINITLDYSIEQETIRTNVVGWTAVVNWIFNKFITQGYGHLAAISSVASLRGLGPAPSYSATKAYQAHYLEALRQRAIVSGKSIFVTNIRPGFVNTPLLANPENFFWVVSVDKAANQIISALDRKKSVVTITRRWKLLVPIILFIPNWLISKIIKRVM